MTDNIRGIGINAGAVNAYGNQAKSKDAKTEDKEKEVKQAPAQGNAVKPDDVLSFMAQSAMVIQPKAQTKTYDVSKYVSPEQAERIAGFMAGFENKVTEGLLAIDAEFGGNAPLNDQAKYELAAKMV